MRIGRRTSKGVIKGVVSKTGEIIRTISAAVGVTLLGFLAIGCSQPASETATTQEIPKLTLWQADFRPDSLENALTNMNASTVSLTSRQLDPAIFETKTVDAIAADEDPDIWLLPNDWLPDQLNKLVTIPNDFWVSDKEGGAKTTLESFKNNYYDWLVDDLTLVNYQVVPNVDVANAASTEIRFAGFPGPVKTLILYKNQTIFAQAYQSWRSAHRDATEEEHNHIRQILTKDIKTWDQLVEASNIIKAVSGTTVTTAGIALGTANNVSEADDIVQLLTYQQGGQIVNAVEKIALFDGFEKTADGRTIYPGQEALTFYTNFANPNHPNYTWNSTLPPARQAFLNGQAAMIIDYPEFEDVIRQQQNRVNADQAPVPQLYEETEPVNFANYYIFGITKGTTDQIKAALFAKNFTVPSALNYVVRGLTNSSSPLKDQTGNSVNDQQSSTARTVYKRKHQQFDATFKEMIDNVALSGQTVADSVKRAADQITKLLQSE